MGKGGSSATIGYWYAVGMHMVSCHGPVDEVSEIQVGDKSAWLGSISSNFRVYINQPELFGGEDHEGGVVGFIDMMFGADDQPCNDYLVDRIGGGPAIGDPNLPNLADGVIVNPDGTVTNPDGSIIVGYNFTTGLVVTWRAVPIDGLIPDIGATVDVFIALAVQPPQLSSNIVISDGIIAFVAKVTAQDVENSKVTVECVEVLAGIVGNSFDAPNTLLTVSTVLTADEIAAAGHPLVTRNTASIILGDVGTIIAVTVLDATAFPSGAYYLFSDGQMCWVGLVVTRVGAVLNTEIVSIQQGEPGDHAGANNNVTYYSFPGEDVVSGGAGQSGYIPAFRGVLSFVLRQTWVSAISAYIKPWAFRVRRRPKALSEESRAIDLNYSTSYQEFTGLTTDDVTAGTVGNTTTTITTDSLGNAVITQVTVNTNGVTITQVTVNGTTTTSVTGFIRAANPAAMIAECFLNTQWGLGFSEANLVLSAFETSAATLLNEGFGMCIVWADQTRMEDFINQILKTINAVRYEEPDTGRIGIRLIRDDYDIDTLPVLDMSNVVQVSSLARPDGSDIINQVTINFTDRSTGVDRSITAHNGASIDQVGGVNPTTIDYPGIPTMDIAKRVALRELASYSRGMAGAKLIANRGAGGTLKAGDVVKFNWPPLNIVGMVLRINEIDYGLLTDNRVTVSAIEDFFAFPNTTYIGTGGSGWIDPNRSTKPVTRSKIFEVPYYIFQTEIASDLDSSTILPNGYSFVGAVAALPQSTGTQYSLYEDSTGTYVDKVDQAYTPYGITGEGIDDKEESVHVTFFDMNGLKLNSYAFMDDEILGVTGINGNVVTFQRAVLDTVPVPHAAGSTIWFAGGGRAIEKVIFLSGQSINVKLQARSPTGSTPLGDIAAQPITFQGRAERPYPPGNIRVDGVYRNSGAVTVALTQWSHRNRLTQTGGFVAQTTGDITPEAGTSYTVNVYQRASITDPWVLAETASGITGNSYTPTTAAELFLRIEIFSVRDGLSSFQTQVVEVSRSGGFGINFGNTFGE